MADKQIGIKLDVRQTGLQQVDDALETISKNLADMNESVVKQQQKGWGSESQTKELREQLRQMQQMTSLYERIARTQGRDSSSFGNFRSEMGGMSRDLNALPSYRTGAIGGYVQQRFGENAASGMDKVVAAIGKLGAMYAGFSLASTMHSGLSRGDQLAFGYGDISKRMGNRGSAMSYAKDMTKGLDGYGFDDMSVMQSTAGYSSVTGRMNPSDLKSQMKTILSTGRRFGMSDPSAITSAFGDAFSSGVTGGSGAQMKPQDFANLLANAISSGRMQGKEGKMLEQLTQVTQMSMQSMGNAGSEKTIASLLSMGNRTGNQALIGNLPSMMSSIDQGISNPSGGYAGQALMMRAIGGGKMNFWDEQFLQSKGALGRETDSKGNEVGQTNIEKATSYLMKTFKGNKNRQYMMLGQMFNLKPAQAKQYIDAYTKDGKFDSDSLNQIQSQLGNNPSSVPQTDTDGYRSDQQGLQTGADSSVGQGTTGVRSSIGGFFGDILKNPTVGTGVGLATGGAIIGAAGLKGLSTIWGLRKLIGGAKNVIGGVSGAAGEVAAASAIPPILGANGLPLPPSTPPVPPPAAGGLFKTLGKFLGPLGTVLMGESAANAGDALGDWTFGHKEGMVKPQTLFDNPFKSMANREKWGDTRDPIWKRLFNSKSSSDAAYGPPASGAATPSTTASAQSLVPVVVSTLVALQPYMGQLKGLLGTDSATKLSSLSSDALKNPQIGNAPLLPSSGNGGLQLASYNPSVKRVGGGSRAAFSGSGSSGSNSEFVQQMLPYAQQASAQTGLPVDFILGQWGHESGWGTSDAANKNNNFAGIKPWKGASAGANKTYAGYGSKGEFADGYANFYKQNGRYKGLLEAAKNGASSDDLAKILGGTGYAEDPNYVGKLQGSIHSVDGVRPQITGGLTTASANRLKVDGGSITVHVKTDNGSQSFKAPISAQFTGLREA